MIKDNFQRFFRKWLIRDEVARKIEEEKDFHACFPNFLNHHKNLVKYIQELQKISDQLNELFYNAPKKSNEKRRFAQIMTIRIRDYYETIILCIDLSRLGYSYSVLPLMRAVCESLILLRYVSEKNPHYIEKLLDSDEDGKRVGEMKNKLNDKKITQYYMSLSNLVHVNPIGIQLTYEHTYDGHVRIHQIPPNYEAINEETLVLLIDMMHDCLKVIEKLNKDSNA